MLDLKPIIFQKVFYDFFAQVAQLVEHVLGKDGVVGSIPILGSIKILRGKIFRAIEQIKTEQIENSIAAYLFNLLNFQFLRFCIIVF